MSVVDLWCPGTTTQQPFNGRLSGTTRVGRYTRRNSHPLTPILVNVLPLSPFSICNGPRHPLYSAYVLDSPLKQPLSRSFVVPRNRALLGRARIPAQKRRVVILRRSQICLRSIFSTLSASGSSDASSGYQFCSCNLFVIC